MSRIARRTIAVAGSLLVVLAGAPLSTAIAQDALDAKSAAHLRDAYVADMDSVHVKIVALAKAIPANKYAWRPTAGVRSVSEVLMHVASEWYFYGPRSLGGKEPADFGPRDVKLQAMEKVGGKSEVLAELDKSWAYFRAQASLAKPADLTGKYKPWNLTLDAAAFSMAGDQHEHLGQLIAYARSNGVVPPWSK